MSTLYLSTNYPGVLSTASLRTIGAELNGWFANVGLVQTADTGQVNWSTVTLPAGANLIGYEIWAFKDGSYYFKLEWWTATGNTNCPNFWLTVGTGSDGAGNITGVTYTRTNLVSGNTAPSGSSNYRTMICHTNDFLGVIWKIGINATYVAGFGFAIEKMVDATGAISGNGIVVSWMPLATATLMKKRAISGVTSHGDTTSFAIVPGNASPINTLVNGNPQVFAHQYQDTVIQFSNFMCTLVNSEIPFAEVFTATLVGTAPHTYISITFAMGCGNAASSTNTGYGCGMLWE